MKEVVSYIPLEIGLWKSPDVISAEDVLISQGSLACIPVSITTDKLPLNFDSQRPMDINVTGRSRIAQLGLEFDHRRKLEHILKQHMAGNGSFSMDPFDVEVEAVNRSSRPIEIPRETSLFRLFSERNKPRLEGDGLVKMVKSGRIRVEGREGESWEWAYGKDAGAPIGLLVRIDSENRRWIPPHPNNAPIIVVDNEKDRGGRLALDALLEEVPQSLDEILWIGETASLTLNGADAILDRRAFRYYYYDSSPVGEQTNSRLIDDRTDWKIRVEIRSSTTSEAIPHWVKMHFVES